MDNTIVVAPNAGFCNRIRTMAASIYLSERLKMNIQHLWIGTIYKCANKNIQTIHDNSFEHYFKEKVQRCSYRTMKNEINTVYTEWLPTEKQNSWLQFQSYGQKLLEIKEFRSLIEINKIREGSKSFLIESSHIKNLIITKDEKNTIYQKYFFPKDYYTEEIDNFRGRNVVGVCIRKTDFLIYYPETQIQDELIIRWINSLGVEIYFCSDDKNYEVMMRNKINNSFAPDFNSADYDFLTFLMLSKCIKIYGTAKSSFSEEASYFGGIEYVPLTRDFIASEIIV